MIRINMNMGTINMNMDEYMRMSEMVLFDSAGPHVEDDRNYTMPLQSRWPSWLGIPMRKGVAVTIVGA